VRFLKIFAIIFIGLFLNTNAYSKAYKTRVVFESEYGGIYSLKNPTFSAPKGRYLETFREINNLSDKNCKNYSKNSFFFVNYSVNPRSPFTIQKNGDIKEFMPGFIPDDTIDVKLFWNHYRFYCGGNIEEVLINHSLRDNIFPYKLFHIEPVNMPYHVGDLNSHYVIYKNKQFLLKDVTDENKDKIALKLKEVSKDKISKIKEKSGLVSVNIAGADFGNVIGKAKETCKDLGFNSESEKFSDCVLEVVEISDAYAAAKAQEKILIAKAKEQENIDLEFNYETSSGQKIQKESKWTKFWQGAAWILYEYGDEILALALDLKYDTNLSGYNTTNQVSANSGGLKCVSQRMGKVVHQHCKGADGTHIYCMYQQIGKSVKRTCRDKSRY